jgi:hypothetical protein
MVIIFINFKTTSVIIFIKVDAVLANACQMFVDAEISKNLNEYNPT